MSAWCHSRRSRKRILMPAAKIAALLEFGPARRCLEIECDNFFSLSQWIFSVFTDQGAIDWRRSRTSDYGDARSQFTQHVSRERARANGFKLDYSQTTQGPFN